MKDADRFDRNWSMVAAGAVMTCVAIGVIFSLAVFLEPMGADTGWSRGGVSAAMTFAFISMGIAGFGWGALTDRYGPRVVVTAGTVLLALANVLASRATSLLEFQLLYGVLLGVAAGSFVAPVMATTASWFERHRSLAVSLVSAGMGVAPMTISPLAAWLVTEHGWRTAQWVIGVAALVVLLPATRFMRPPPAVARAAGRGTSATQEMTAGQALRSTPFLVLAATFFTCCATHSGPIFHTVAYAIGCGLPTFAAVTIYSMEGAAGLGGRLLFGVAADRLGAKRVLIAGLVIQAVVAPASRHGAWARLRRLAVRPLRQLHVALSRLGPDRPGGDRDGHPPPAVRACRSARQPRAAYSGTVSISAMMFPSLSLNQAAFAPPSVIAPSALRSPGRS